LSHRLTRRQVLQSLAATGSLAALHTPGFARALCVPLRQPLEEFGYEQIRVNGAIQTAQRQNVNTVLTDLNENSLLKPFREMAGLPGYGISLGGWYEWRPHYDFHHDDAGLAPGATLGQWISALSRLYASSRFGGFRGQVATAKKVVHLNGLLANVIGPSFFAQTRFPAYSLDKLACGLMDAHRLVGDVHAFAILDKITAAALPSLPGHAVDRETQWKMGADISWMWDESYTLPENLYLLSAMGAGERYRAMARSYLDDVTYFEPLSHGENVLADKHAYSYVNALCSAMLAYLVDGSTMHLAAARHGFALLQAQSFATGGWGPDELLRKPGYDQLAKSLIKSHNGFETPCGSYAHLKLTRYLLRATQDGIYGDSMERVMHNTVLGALPLQPDGRSFYSSDYNIVGKRVYSVHRWPCCSGTLPQVVADYGINTYFRGPNAIWINLYQPSELRCVLNGSFIALEQTGAYPETEEVNLRLTTSAPTAFALHLRIPAWTRNRASLRVNGHSVSMVANGGFAAIERTWRNGDVIHLNLPMPLRVEPLPSNGGPAHRKTVALLRGPLVLFAIREPGELGQLSFTLDQLLGAEQTAPLEWIVYTTTGPRRMVPFTAVGEREYSTCVTLI
jgi:DUF1680 family protein